MKHPEGITVTVEEFPHAYLVRGYDIMWGISAKQAKLALFEFLGRKKWTRIDGMPYRPLHTSEIGDKEPTGAVAFYFNIGRRCDSRSCRFCSTHPKDEYKP